MQQPQKNNLPSIILMAGLLVGFLDLSAALLKFYVDTGRSPIRVLQYIASSLFGKDAYSGNWLMISAGILIHFVLAIVFTALFFLLYSRFRFLSENRILSGFGYGILIWFVMNKVAVPLTKATQPPFELRQALIGALILICAIGIPLAYIAEKYYKSFHSGKL